MECKPLPNATRLTLTDTIDRKSEAIAKACETYVKTQDMTLGNLGQLLSQAVELGKLTAILEHDNVARGHSG